MHVWAQINIWEMNHHPTKFIDSLPLDDRIDKSLFMDSLLMELGELETIASNSEEFRWRFMMILKKWELPIRKLLDTMDYEYDPMVNVDYQIQRNLGKEVMRELGRDIVRSLTEAIKSGMTRDVQRDLTTGTDRTFSSVEHKGTDRTYEETNGDDTTGNRSLDETDRHYVSAYDQITPQDADTYSDRDTITRTEQYSENRDGTKNYTDRGTEDGTVSDTESIDRTDTEGTGTSESQTHDKTQNENTGTTENEGTGTSEDEKTHKVGIENITNQSLIEEQRRVVVFNIINWIIDRIARELVVGLW